MRNLFLRYFWRLLNVPIHFAAWLIFLFACFEQSVWQFVVNWFTSRPWRGLVLGFPAIAMAAVIIGTVAYADRIASKQVLGFYERNANQALLGKDLPLAAFYLERLTYLDSSRSPNFFRFAQVLEQLAQPNKAMAVMRKLAPDDHTGFGPAHLWIAKQYVRLKPELGPDDVEMVEKHLKSAVTATSDQVEPRQMLAGLYTGLQRWVDAIQQLEPILSKRPEFHAIVARLHEKAGDITKAKGTAQKGVPKLQKLLSDQPGLTQERFALADLYLVLQQYEAAARLLVAVDKERQDDQWRRALIAVYVNWFDALAQSDGFTPRQLELMEHSLRLGPNDPNVLARLERVVDQRHEAADAMRRILEAAVVQGKSLAPAHLILGTSALRHGNHRAGVHHLTFAFEHDPQLPAVANNLAWGLANSPTPELERAEELIEAAVEAAPQHPEIRETRGQIRAKLGKVKLAIVDLEFALQTLPSRMELHLTLAALYEKIGQASIAEEHRKAAGHR